MSIRNTRTALFVVLLVLLALPVLAADIPAGRISVVSSPTGALACVDNASCDTTGTVFTVEGNAWHTITVSQKGYHLWTEQVYVTADQTSMVEAYLDLDPASTAVKVTVSPGGAVVCLDNGDCRARVGGNSTSGVTVFTGVSAGYHTVSVEAPADYVDTTRLVQVELGKVTDVDIALVPFVSPAAVMPEVTRDTGSIRVYVNRTGSTICLDNDDCFINVGGSPGPGTGTAVFTDVTANQVHIITIAADGFMPVSTKIVVGKDQVATADVSLQPAGTLTPVITDTPMTLPPTEPPTMPTPRSAPGMLPVLGALALCGAILLAGKRD